MNWNRSKSLQTNPFKSGKGVYQLLLYLGKSVNITIGKKGTFKFLKGYYVYTGSAKRGLKSRVTRHLQKNKKHFWHIDYLLDHASVRKISLFLSKKANECSLSHKTRRTQNAKVIVPGFGASDCSCPTHLVFFERLKEVPENGATCSFSLRGKR